MSLLFRKPEHRSSDWFAVGEQSPATVTENSATHLAPVFATFRHLVDYVSTLPADFYRVEGDKRVKVGVPELLRNIDAEIGLETWLGQAIYGIAARGNAVGKVTSMSAWRLPTMIEWAGSWSGGELGYDWYLNGEPVAPSLVAHVPWIVPPGRRVGLSPIEHYAAIVQAGLAAQDYANVRRGGDLPATVLKNTAKVLVPEEASRAQARAVAAFAAGKPWVTGSDWELSTFTIPANQAQFIETLRLSANQIAAIYGVDPREVGGTADSSLTYSNDESRALNRAQNATPYVVRIEKAIDRWLPSNTIIKLNMNARIRADIKTQTDVVGQKLADGRLNLNEARALDELPPLASGGDFHNVPVPTTVPTQREGV